MSRKLSDSEKSLWERVTATVRRFGRDQSAMVPTKGSKLACSPRQQDFNPVLDLHGMTLVDAHRVSLEHVYQAKQAGGYRYVTIITGLSGQICEEFPRWFENHSLVRSVKALRGGGAWEVWLVKNVT
jgi:DNA-nicking Smr family endonuclease